MEQFLPFFLVLLAGVFFSEVFRRFNLPWVIALIFAGAVIGPHLGGWVEFNDTIEFIGQIGLVFLMFMAGLETRVSSVKGARLQVISLGLINSLLPFLGGLSLMLFLDYDPLVALVVGVIFISSSVAVVVPTMEQAGLLDHRLGRLIIPATVMQDVLSLVLLSVLFQTVDQVTALPLPLFYLTLFSILLLLRWSIPRIEEAFLRLYRDKNDPFQQEIRVVLTLLIGVVIIFELLGLHPIIAGFFAGLILSDTVKREYFKERLRAISYGVFIPTFFVITGARLDLEVFVGSGEALAMIGLVVAGSVLFKFASSWLGAKTIGERGVDSLLVATSTIPQLSTTLAVVAAGLTTGLLDPTLGTGLIILSVVTTIIGPLLFRALVGDRSRAEREELKEKLTS